MACRGRDSRRSARYGRGDTTQNHGDLTEMTPPVSRHERIANMIFADIYPLYVNKVEKKGRTEEELLQVLKWLTGFTNDAIQKHIDKESTIEEFFAKAKLNPKASSIKGVICGYRVEEIENPLTQKTRYMDKLVDELAGGSKVLAKPAEEGGLWFQGIDMSRAARGPGQPIGVAAFVRADIQHGVAGSDVLPDELDFTRVQDQAISPGPVPQ